ncbi:MAG: S1 RNA-binding domain-containing protein [Egibacteraceae bacterium]
MDGEGDLVATAAQAEALAARILDCERMRPLVGVSTHWSSGQPCVDVAALRAEVAAVADVAVVETGEASWALATALPERLDVYNGALRLWRPGVEAGADRRAHPLLMIRSPGDASAAVGRLRSELGMDGDAGSSSVERPVVGATVTATVVAVTARDATVDIAGTTARVARSGLAQGRISDARDVLRVGQAVRARVLRVERDGPVVTLKTGSPSPWRQFVIEYAEGDVVRGRVDAVRGDIALVEVAPGVRGRLDRAQMAADTALAPGQVIAVRIVSFDQGGAGLALSMASVGPTERPRPGLVVLPDGPVFLGAGEGEETRDLRASLDAANARLAALEADCQQLQGELDAVCQDRQRAFEALRATRAQAHELRKQVRGERERRRQLQARLGLAVEVSDAEEFVEAVRAAYQRLYPAADRQRYPLSRMRVGAQLLDRLDELDAVPADKVVEVCAHVAAGRHWEIAGLQVHQLRDTVRGSVRVRASDGAQAWRCALQLNRPSARRLHWWEIPGTPRAVEFASVGVHDDVDIPC